MRWQGHPPTPVEECCCHGNCTGLRTASSFMAKQQESRHRDFCIAKALADARAKIWQCNKFTEQKY